MRKRILLFLSSLFTPLFALPIGNPAEPHLIDASLMNHYDCAWLAHSPVGLRGGFYGDYVFNRYLQVDQTADHSQIQDSRINTNAGFIALDFCHIVDCFATLGATRFEIKTPSDSFRTDGLQPGEYFTILTDSGFSWSIGGRAALFQWCCFTLGVEGQYFSSSPSINYVKEEADLPIYLAGQDFDYREWQVGLALAREFYSSQPCFGFVPYIGVSWSGVCVDMDDLVVINPNVQTDTFVLRDLENSKLWGYAIGITFTLNRMISVMVERRFGDENALHANGQIHF